MAKQELLQKDIENLIINNAPSIEDQKKMVQEIEGMIAKGVSPEQALESVLDTCNNDKH
jgi:uncharacterized protein YoaH (UPF0181 family)